MTDVFDKAIKNVEGTNEDERLQKINEILKNIKEGNQANNVNDATNNNQNEEQKNQQEEENIDNNENNNTLHNEGEDYQSKYFEALDIIKGLEEELQEKDNLEAELAKAHMKIRMLEAEIETLSGTTKKYMEQVHSIEYDANRMQVPADMISIIKYYKDAQGDDDYAKEAKRLLQSELIRLVEKTTGKPLTNYIVDLRTYGAEPMGQGGVSSMNIPQTQQVPQKSKYELLGNIF